ncbi:unnamed protein product [Amaranthus hypochondriacus]
MPSLSMKNCVKEKTCLRLCHKSRTISKSSNVKTCQSCPEVFSSCGLNNQNTGIVKTANSDERQSDEGFFKRMIEGMESSSVSCSTNFGTIFSPTLCQIDVRDVPNTNENSGVDIHSKSFTSNMADESNGNSGSLFDNQGLDLSDLISLDWIPLGSEFDDIADKRVLAGHGTAEPNNFSDSTERHMALPFLNDSVDYLSDMLLQPSEDSNNSDFLYPLSILEFLPGKQEADCASFDPDEGQYIDPYFFINLPDLTEIVSSTWPTMLPKKSRESKSITLVLDLDETLVHSSLKHCENANFCFTYCLNMKEHTVYVKERPHLRTFLKKVAEMFQIVIFTASQSVYAKQLLDILDPDGKLISRRAYRESCIFSDGTCTKDLTVLGFDLAKVLIVDNTPQVFRLQINNGIPIKSWYNDPSDNELMSLIPFLETLTDVDDVRPHIARRFGNKE